MKARTRAILKAADKLCERWSGRYWGVCDTFQYSSHATWFNNWFAPIDKPGIDGNYVFWLGQRTSKNLERRYTFIAMAAAVSETEE